MRQRNRERAAYWGGGGQWKILDGKKGRGVLKPIIVREEINLSESGVFDVLSYSGWDCSILRSVCKIGDFRR